MQNGEILEILKIDLQISSCKYDTYLGNLLTLAARAIQEEGIILNNSIEDNMLVEMYAAYLYRKRREESLAMPRSLRYMLNNRLIAGKAGDIDG